jgi:predicted amidohydrolase
MVDTPPPRFAALALQLTAQAVDHLPDRDAVQAAVLAQIADVATKLRGACIFVEQYSGSPVRLAVLPEYLFTSYPVRISIPDFAAKVAFDMDDAAYDALGKMAQAQGIYLSGNAYERDPHFPGLYFQTCFIIAPSGDMILRYRRLNSMFAPTPHDVWSKYLDVYGRDAVFPVARTDIGNLAAIASEEILYPEIARAHGLKGAEIFVHNSSEIGSPLRTPKMIAKQARAFENMAYVVSANTAGIASPGSAAASADGNSMVVDYKGMVLAEASPGETFTAFADVDLAALRAHRRKPGMVNMLARQRTGLFADSYTLETHQRANALINDEDIIIPDREHFKRTAEQTIDRLSKDGLI